MNPHSALWNLPVGRELDSTPMDDTVRPTRIVACLNVWNDVTALMRTVPMWLPHVDHIIVVDGAYNTSTAGLSSDGTHEFFQTLALSHSVEMIDGAGLSQCEKRTKYLAAGREGDYLFVIDADEEVTDARSLRTMPICDVGWIRVKSTLYTREYGQPRIFRWQPDLAYRGRHHWTFCGERLLCTHQYGGPGFVHRPVATTIFNQRRMGRSISRMQSKHAHQTIQSVSEANQSAMPPRSTKSDAQTDGREALQILAIAYRDDGLAPSRLHTAINRTTPHGSIFFKSRPGPFEVRDQYSPHLHGAKLAHASAHADVIHYHGVMSLAQRQTRDASIVFHHHGSMLRANAQEYNTQARLRGALVLVSNLELLSWTEDLPAKFLPNAIPAGRYAALAAETRTPFTGSNRFRVAHSPSKPERKGTEHFLAACKNLAEKGVPIEPVIIHGVSHSTALALKASCHASFDSFWLGIQCSGVEAAAMQMPVIAGDPTVARRYEQHFGAIPYTFANDRESLEDMLFKLVDDAAFRQAEQDRVHRYVIDNHDESSVALTYLDYLDDAFSWRTGKPRVVTTYRMAFRSGARV